MSEYQLRVSGKPKRYFSCIGRSELDEWREFCIQHPKCQVEIVQITENVIINQFNYGVFENHFKADKS